MNFSELTTHKEGNRLEAKAAQGGIPRSIWETISAFANTSGGVVLLGVAERKGGTLEPVGLVNAHKMLDDFWNAALSPDKLSSRILRDEDARIEEIDGKEIIVIDIPRANRHERPVFLDRDILGSSFRRTHTGDHRCSREEVRFMLMDASTESQDSRIAERGDIDELDYDTIQRYRRKFETSNPDHIWINEPTKQFLFNIGAADYQDGELMPTEAGLLMFGKDRWISRQFPHYFLDYRQETGANERWEDRFTSQPGDWSGNLYDFYIRVYNKLKHALKVPFKLEGMQRVDDTSAHKALREALVNCLTNANYHDRRGIVCVWREDALTIENPGDFRLPLAEALQPGKSDPRNETLQKMFAMIDVGERAGSGMAKIMRGWQEAGYPAPHYETEYAPDRTVLTLPLRNMAGEPVEEANGKTTGSVSALSEREALVLSLISRDGKITTRVLSEEAGLSKQTASSSLKEMAAKGLLVWQGKSLRDPWQFYTAPQASEGDE